MLTDDVAKNVLLTGPRYRNHRGGIGGVLATYLQHFPGFRHIPTYHPFRWKVLYLPYFAWNYLRFVAMLIGHPKLRIVHLHGASEGSIYRKFVLFWTAKHVFGRKVVFHLHSGTFLPFYDRAPGWVRGWMRQLAEKTDAFVCLSEGWRRIYAERFPKANLYVMPNPVTPPTDGPTGPARSGTLRLLYLGVITEPKGIFDLVHVLHRFQKKGAERVHLTIGGDGDMKRLRTLLRELNLETTVHCAGWVSGASKELLLREADAFVLPSYTEGLPLSILEAMSHGLPILSTRVGGIPELVTEGDNGFLVEPGDEAALSNRLQRWLDDPQLLQRMGQRSAERAEFYFPQAVFGRLGSLYDALLKSEAKPVGQRARKAMLFNPNEPHLIFEKYPYLC